MDQNRLLWTGLDGNADALGQDSAPSAGGRGDVPAWARSNDACVELMLAHGCYVAQEVTDDGADVMVARWKDADGSPERIAVPTSEHASEAAAFRYAAVLGVTSKVEADSRARELKSMVST